jgi:hypothetical protein
MIRRRRVALDGERAHAEAAERHAHRQPDRPAADDQHRHPVDVCHRFLPTPRRSCL